MESNYVQRLGGKNKHTQTLLNNFCPETSWLKVESVQCLFLISRIDLNFDLKPAEVYKKQKAPDVFTQVCVHIIIQSSLILNSLETAPNS